MTSSERVRAQIADLEKRATEVAVDEELLRDALRQIEMDLDNTLDEYVSTTGRPAASYHKWRRSAKWAKYHKVKELDRKAAEVRALHTELMNTRMMLYAEESRYRGADDAQLLRAMYHLTMEILDHTTFKLDEHQLGLVAAVRMKEGG